jgi:hypothetical protein
MLLTDPQGWGSFYDVRITSVEPPGPAVLAETGPLFVHLTLTILFRQDRRFVASL